MRLFRWLLPLALLLAGWGWWWTSTRYPADPSPSRPQVITPVCATNLPQLLASAPSQLGQYDIALVNLLCASGLPGAENLNPQECLGALDRWTERVRAETDRHLYRYRANPAEFESSEAYFRMLMMAVVLYEDFGVRYNPARISTPNAIDPNDHFFADSRDLFLHGLLAPRINSQLSTVNHPTGTCSSMPVLYVAIGRRLGYPLKLATTKAHLFLRWEGHGERFNLEATGKGMNRYDDEHFRQWPFPVTEEEIQADGYLKSLAATDELALFLSLRGHCLQEAGRTSEAVAAYSDALRLAPDSRPYRLLLAAAHEAARDASPTRGRPLPVPRQPPPPALLVRTTGQLSTLTHPPNPNPLLKLQPPTEPK